MAKEEELKEIWKAMKEKGHFYGYDTYEAWRTRNNKGEKKEPEKETKSKTYQSFRRSLSKKEEDDYKNIFGEN
jgi:hypothetical protein